MKVAFRSWRFIRDVAAQHLMARRHAHVKEYFSFHMAALIIGRVEQSMYSLEQETKHLSSALLICSSCRSGGYRHLRHCAESVHTVRCA